MAKHVSLSCHYNKYFLITDHAIKMVENNAEIIMCLYM